jgi:hypothetical protein
MSQVTLSDSHIIASADDLLTTEFDSEVVILDLRDGVYYGLEHVGARVWTLLRHPVTLASLRDAIASEYDVDPDRCAEDVRDLVRELAAHNLVMIRTA